MSEKRTKKAVEEAKEAKANEQIRRKSGKVLELLVSVGTGADFWVSQGCRKITRRPEGEGKYEGYGKEEAR